MANSHGGLNDLVDDKTVRRMPWALACATLASAHRDTLSDSAFGDAEVGWILDGKEIAIGYFGRAKHVTILATSEYAATTFVGPEARVLRTYYKTASYQSNN